jgi:hypothetical protein
MSSDKRIIKPSREPDFIDDYGGYYWFEEGLFLSGTTSLWYTLSMHPKLDRMIREIPRVGIFNPARCQCISGEICLYCGKFLMEHKAEQARKDLAWKAFEEIVLGDKKDER